MVILQQHTFAMPVDITLGDYQIMLGLYNWQTGESLPLDDGSGDAIAFDIMVK